MSDAAPATTEASARPAAPIADVSHGRGGAGNIKPDDTQYTDGSVTRQGAEGSHNDGSYSAGRGGAGNIGDKGVKHSIDGRADQDVVPPEATRPEGTDHHHGRGGFGNEEHLGGGNAPASTPASTPASAPNSSAQMSLADKLKYKIFPKK